MRSKILYAYVGTRTSRERNARGEGISVYKADQDKGSLELIQVVGDLVNPSFLALNKQASMLYTVHGDEHEVSAFKVNPDGTLSYFQSLHCGGKNPVHLALDPTEAYLLVSNHLSHNVAVMPILENGAIGPVCQIVEMQGTPGPHRKEQPFAKPHFNPFDPSGKFVVVPDKGLDRIFVFKFDNGVLREASTPWVDTRETAGPRHIAFHPQRPYAFVVNELDSTVTSYRFDAATGKLEPLQILSTLPDSYTGNNRASEIMVSTDGQHLYASNRGDDSIAVFKIMLDTGRLSFLNAHASHGRTPRFFTLSPNGKFVFALNEDSDSIVTFPIDAKNGQFESPSLSTHCASPVCMVFALVTSS